MGWRDEIQRQKQATTSGVNWRDAVQQAKKAADEPPVPEPVREEAGGAWEKVKALYSGAKEMVTGAERETRATKEIPSMADVGVNYLLGDGVNTAQKYQATLALLTAFDPESQIEIIKANTSDPVSEFTDEKGNYGVNVGGRVVMLNKPGADAFDGMQFGTIGAAFTPAGRAAVGSPTVLNGMMRVGGASAGTQAGILAGQAASGRDVSVGDVVSEVGMAGAFGAGGEMLFQGLARIPGLKNAILQRMRAGKVTPEARATFIKAATELGFNPDDITDDLILKYTQLADDAVSSADAPVIGLEKEFNIPLTKGERTLNPAQLDLEDTIRMGGKGNKAQEIFLGLEGRQKEAAKTAAAELQEKIAGNATPLTHRADAGAAIKEGVKSAEQVLARQVDDAYAAIQDAALNPDGLKGMMRSMRNSVRGVEFDRTLPETNKLLSRIHDFERLMGQKGVRMKPMHIREIDNIRKRINTALGSATGSDARQVLLMKKSMDDFLDEAVINQLFSGDPGSLHQLKAARSLAREYFKKFTEQKVKGKRSTFGDPAGKFIEKIVAANPTDEEVISALFSASNFSNKAGTHMARRFKEIVGPDSDEWNMVRQAAFRNLLKEEVRNGERYIAGGRTLNAIDDAWQKNRDLMKELFSADELATFRRYALAVKRTQPDLIKSRATPSGKHGVKALTEKLMDILPFMQGDPILMTSGMGISAAKGVTGAAKARDAFRPFAQIEPVKPSLVGGSVAGGMQATQN